MEAIHQIAVELLEALDVSAADAVFTASRLKNFLELCRRDEVLYLGRNVNPVNYFNRNMTSDEYRQLMDNMKYNSDLETEEGTSNE